MRARAREGTPESRFSGALLDREGWSVPNSAWGAAAAPNFDELDTRVAWADRASRPRPLNEGNGSGRQARPESVPTGAPRKAGDRA